MGPDRPVAAVAQEGIGGAAIETSSSVNSTTIARERPRTQKDGEAPERTEAFSRPPLPIWSLAVRRYSTVTMLINHHEVRG